MGFVLGRLVCAPALDVCRAIHSAYLHSNDLDALLVPALRVVVCPTCDDVVCALVHPAPAHVCGAHRFLLLLADGVDCVGGGGFRRLAPPPLAGLRV